MPRTFPEYVDGAVFHASHINDVYAAIEEDTGPIFDLQHYQAVLNGTADDRVPLLNAIAAAAVQGGTVVWYGELGFTGLITVPDSVNLRGYGHSRVAGKRCSVLKALDALAQISFGDTVTPQYGGISGNFIVDGNGVAPDPFVVGYLNARRFESIFVQNTAAGGSAVTLKGTQNSQFASLHLETLGGHGLTFDLGAGSNDVFGLNVADAAGYAIRYIQSGPALSGLVDYPLLNRIWGFIAEHFTTGGSGLVYHGVGSENKIIGGVFSLAAITSPKSILTMRVDDVTRPSSHLTLENLTWYGVQAHAKAIDLGAGTTCVLNDTQNFGGLSHALYCAAGSIVYNHSLVTLGSVSNWFGTPDTGLENTIVRSRQRSPIELTRSLSTDWSLLGAVAGEAFARWAIDAAGAHLIGPGSANFDTSIYRGGPDLLATDDRFRILHTATDAFLIEKANGTDVFLINSDGQLIAAPNGSAVILYSDNYVTVKGLWSGVNGDITLKGAIDHDGTTLGFFGKVPATQSVANADTSGATLAALETEVNELKALLRSYGLLAT